MNSTGYEVVEQFEKTIAEFTGAPYAVAVDSCTNAIFLCLCYWKPKIVKIPKYTYPSVVCAAIHVGSKVEFIDFYWGNDGSYIIEMPRLSGRIIDSALCFKKNMFVPIGKSSFVCLSFHVKKQIPIGRGGIILTDSEAAVDWFKRARFDGRGPVPLSEDRDLIVGWNMYMTPEQAARGLVLFNAIKDKDLKSLDFHEQNYPDLSKVEAYKQWTD